MTVKHFSSVNIDNAAGYQSHNAHWNVQCHVMWTIDDIYQNVKHIWVILKKCHIFCYLVIKNKFLVYFFKLLYPFTEKCIIFTNTQSKQ